MELKNINDLSKEIPQNQQDAILGLIDLKTNEDMKAVITEIQKLRHDMDSKFNAMDSKFNAIDSKFNAMDSKFNAMDSKFTTIFWVLGVLATTLVGILLKILIG